MSLHLGNTAVFEMPRRWRAVGNNVFDLTHPKFEPQTFCSRDKRIIPVGPIKGKAIEVIL